MKITVETHVKAPIAAVWAAYTTPADIVQWNTASPDWHTTRASVAGVNYLGRLTTIILAGGGGRSCR